MLARILIGNLITLIASCFTVASSVLHNPKQIYLCQTAQCFLIAVASIFFQSYAGLATMLLCALRNLITAYGRFTGRVCVLFLAVLVPLGLAVNNRGIWGLIPVIATLLYTAGQWRFRTELTIKGNMIVNLLLWVIYDIYILDIVSAVVDTVSAVLATLSLRGRKGKSPELPDSQR